MTAENEKARLKDSIRREFDGLIHDLSHTLLDAYRPYRPEKHYMRGPGPKWRAKYGTPAEKDDHRVGTVRVHI